MMSLQHYIDQAILVLFGVYCTFLELNIIERVTNWWKGKPQIEEQLAYKAIREIGRAKEGKTAIITGANSGVGLETAKHLAAVGYHVILGVRSESRGKEAINEIVTENKKMGLPHSVEVIALDLSSFDSIRKFVEKIKKNKTSSNHGYNIDLLINNAGVMFLDYSLTKDGIEQHFGVNYMGHYLLTMLLLPIMEEPGRVLLLTSSTYVKGSIPFHDINQAKHYSKFYGYANSKLAVMMFGVSLSQKLQNSKKNINVYLVNPGTVRTNITTNLPIFLKTLYETFGGYLFKTVFQGACTSIYCSLSKDITSKTGILLFECRESAFENKKRIFSDIDRDNLWKVAEKFTNEKFPF